MMISSVLTEDKNFIENADPSTRRLGMAAVQGALIGGGAGRISYGMKNVYTDIAKKRVAGEFR